MSDRDGHMAPLAQSDLGRLAALEKTAPSPWSTEQLSQELGLAHGWHFGFRRQKTEPLSGYIFGIQVVDQAEIRKLCVAPEKRRQGVAGQLLSHSLQVLASQGIGYCFLEVRESNRAAIDLYQKFGFTVSGTRENYYAHPKENAIIMEKSLEKH